MTILKTLGDILDVLYAVPDSLVQSRVGKPRNALEEIIQSGIVLPLACRVPLPLVAITALGKAIQVAVREMHHPPTVLMESSEKSFEIEKGKVNLDLGTYSVKYKQSKPSQSHNLLGGKKEMNSLELLENSLKLKHPAALKYREGMGAIDPLAMDQTSIFYPIFKDLPPTLIFDKKHYITNPVYGCYSSFHPLSIREEISSTENLLQKINVIKYTILNKLRPPNCDFFYASNMYRWDKIFNYPLRRDNPLKYIDVCDGFNDTQLPLGFGDAFREHMITTPIFVYGYAMSSVLDYSSGFLLPVSGSPPFNYSFDYSAIYSTEMLDLFKYELALRIQLSSLYFRYACVNSRTLAHSGSTTRITNTDEYTNFLRKLFCYTHANPLKYLHLTDSSFEKLVENVKQGSLLGGASSDADQKILIYTFALNEALTILGSDGLPSGYPQNLSDFVKHCLKQFVETVVANG